MEVEMKHLLKKYHKGIAKVSPELYDEVVERSGGICEICGNEVAVEVHHVCGRRRVAWLGNLKHLGLKCHKPPSGVHADKELNDRVMKEMQDTYFNMGFNEDEVRYLLGTKSGKLY